MGEWLQVCKLTVLAKQDQLGQVQNFVEKRIQGKLSPRATQHILLAVEEVFINIARYAYPQHHGAVDITCTVGQQTIALLFSDEGIPYNPLLRDKPDISLPAERRAIGGLGIYLTRELMDSMSYRREDGHNILCIEKRITPADGLS